MKNRKTIIALLLVAIVGIVGLTIAYFANSQTIENNFITKEYGTEVVEEFVSPDNWLPGDTTNKTVVAENTGQVDQAVRVKLIESWTTHNNGTLNGWIHPDGSKSTHTTQTELATDERVAILNLGNTSDWTKVGDYYYYNYKLAPGESTTTFLESVTFNSKTKLDDTCETTIDEGVRTISCNSSGDDYDYAKYKLTINIETVQYNKYNDAWNLNNAVTILAAKPMTMQQYIVSKTNAANAEYNAETKKKMFTFTHGEGANAVTESRYIGDDPNNYVYFNCDDMDNQSSSTCEVWRILGVFDVDDGTGNIEQRMKLVRGSVATTMNWNTNYENDWTAANASLKNFLNGDYYNRSGNAATYGLKASARNIIDNAKYYLGAGPAYDSTTHFGTTETIYAWERGTTLCYNCKNYTTKLTWTGIVGLMYPSDVYMVYGNGVNATCYNDPDGCKVTNAQTGWVYNSNIIEGQTSTTHTLLLSPRSDKNSAFSAYASGYLTSSQVYNQSEGVRPVVYLKSDIKITEGTGESGSPFKLGL